MFDVIDDEDTHPERDDRDDDTDRDDSHGEHAPSAIDHELQERIRL